MPIGRRHGHQATLGPISFLLRPLHLTLPQLCGFWRSLADGWRHRSRRLQGQRRHLLEPARAEQALACTARAGGAEGSTRSECGPGAGRERRDAPPRPALGRGGQVASTCSTHNKALQQGRALTCWPWIVTGQVAWPAFLLGRAFLPAPGAWMGRFPSGRPGLSGALLRRSPPPWPLAHPRATLGTSTRVTRMRPETPGESTR